MVKKNFLTFNVGKRACKALYQRWIKIMLKLNLCVPTWIFDELFFDQLQNSSIFYRFGSRDIDRAF